MEILKGRHIFPSWRRTKGKTVQIRGLVCAVRKNEKTGIFEIHETENIVTNDGDLFYAERAALLTAGTPIGPVPTNFTDANGVPDMIMELYDNTGSAPGKASDRSTPGTIIGTGKVIDATYPQVNDGDADNTGAGTDIVTYRVSFTTAEVNGAIDDVILTNPSPGASEPCIMHADGLAVTKTSSDTLKVFVNHTFNGV